MQRSCERSPSILLDHLRNHQVRPNVQTRTSSSTTLTGPKGLSHQIDRRLQPIGHEQQWAEVTTGGHERDHALIQATVARRADRAAQPQARTDHQRESHPHNTSLRLEPKLVSLDLPKVTWNNDLLVMHAFTMLSRRIDPLSHRLGLEAKGSFDGRDWAAVPDQRHHTTVVRPAATLQA